jgi:hypothetical protein
VPGTVGGHTGTERRGVGALTSDVLESVTVYDRQAGRMAANVGLAVRAGLEIQVTRVSPV